MKRSVLLIAFLGSFQLSSQPNLTETTTPPIERPPSLPEWTISIQDDTLQSEIKRNRWVYRFLTGMNAVGTITMGVYCFTQVSFTDSISLFPLAGTCALLSSTVVSCVAGWPEQICCGHR